MPKLEDEEWWHKSYLVACKFLSSSKNVVEFLYILQLPVLELPHQLQNQTISFVAIY